MAASHISTTIYILFLDAQEKSSTQDGTSTANTAEVNSSEPGGEEGEADTTTSNSSNNSTNTKETVSFKVIYNKQKHDVTFPLDDTVIDLKKHLEEITGEIVLLIGTLIVLFGSTLDPACNEQIDAKKTARCRQVLVVTKLFYTAVNVFDAKKSTRRRRVLVATELVVSGTHCALGSTYTEFG